MQKLTEAFLRDNCAWVQDGTPTEDRLQAARCQVDDTIRFLIATGALSYEGTTADLGEANEHLRHFLFRNSIWLLLDDIDVDRLNRLKRQVIRVLRFAADAGIIPSHNREEGERPYHVFVRHDLDPMTGRPKVEISYNLRPNVWNEGTGVAFFVDQGPTTLWTDRPDSWVLDVSYWSGKSEVYVAYLLGEREAENEFRLAVREDYQDYSSTHEQ